MERLGAIISVARQYKRYGYEVWELVNEVYILGRYKTVRSEFLFRRIHWDIQEYIRTQTKSRRRTKQPEFISGNTVIFTTDNKCTELFDNLGLIDKSYEAVDVWDWVESQNLSSKNMLILKLRYIEGMALKDVGKVLGVSESRVSQVHTDLIKLLKCKWES